MTSFQNNLCPQEGRGVNITQKYDDVVYGWLFRPGLQKKV